MKHRKLLVEFAHADSVEIQPEKQQTFAEKALAEVRIADRE
jgi:hypothetical protein